MKKKIGTMLDEELIFKAKQAALLQRQTLSHFLTDALNMYLRSLRQEKRNTSDRRLCHHARSKEYFVNTEKIQDMRLDIKPLVFETLVNSHVTRLSSGLMINHSLIIAGMKQDRIKLLATSDSVFKNVTEIQMCTPGDLTLS